MKIVIHGKQLTITPAIKDYVEKKLGKAEKHYDKIIEMDVTLSASDLKSGPSHIADVKVHVSGSLVKGSATAPDLYAAIDEVVDIIEAQLKKLKEQRKDDNHVGHGK